MMKIERLLAITNYLLSNKRVTAQMLSGRFNVSTRKIEDDKIRVIKSNITEHTRGI